MTFRELVGNAHKSLKQKFDDSEITFPQVAYWCGFFLNKYKAQEAVIDYTGGYLTIYPSVTVTKPAASSTTNIVKGRKYFTLPTSIYDLSADRGVNYISYHNDLDVNSPTWGGVKFTRTQPSKAELLYSNDYEYPSPDNPYFYVVGNIVGLLGVENITLAKVEVGLITTFDPLSSSFDMDAELTFGATILDEITKEVLELGMFVMNIPIDEINDGSDTSKEEIASNK